MPAISNDGMALEKLRKMIASSLTFQAETGGSVSAAETHVYYGSVAQLGNQAAYPRPLAMIGLADRLDRLISGGNQNVLRESGAIWLTMIRNISGTLDTNAEYLAQLEWMSKVLKEVADLSGSDDASSPYTTPESHLSIVRIDNDAFGLVEMALGTTMVQFFGLDTTVWWGDSDRIRGMV